MLTFAEAGLTDYAPVAWQGILAPAGTPTAIVEKISAAMQKATQNPVLAEKWRSYGGELRATTPADFAAFIKADLGIGKALSAEFNSLFGLRQILQ